MKMDQEFLQQLDKILEKKFNLKLAPVNEMLKGVMDQTARTMVDVTELRLDVDDIKIKLVEIDKHLDEIDETLDFHHKDITRLLRVTPNMKAEIYDLNKRVTKLEEANTQK